MNYGQEICDVCGVARLPAWHVCSACADALEECEQGYRLGCIVGAAIVAWGDAMRKREEAKQRAKDWEDRKLEADMG